MRVSWYSPQLVRPRQRSRPESTFAHNPRVCKRPSLRVRPKWKVAETVSTASSDTNDHIRSPQLGLIDSKSHWLNLFWTIIYERNSRGAGSGTCHAPRPRLNNRSTCVCMNYRRINPFRLIQTRQNCTFPSLAQHQPQRRPGLGVRSAASRGALPAAAHAATAHRPRDC